VILHESPSSSQLNANRHADKKWLTEQDQLHACHCMSLPIASQITQYCLQAGYGLAYAVASAEMALLRGRCLCGSILFETCLCGSILLRRVFCGSILLRRVLCGLILSRRCLCGSIRLGRVLCGLILSRRFFCGSICLVTCLLRFDPFGDVSLRFDLFGDVSFAV
jgi:hypothetical protein